MSPDDLLDNGAYRVRQNVVLEIGYFIGKIGKHRVRILKNGNVDMPSDLQGILYENYDGVGAWKMKLLKEMRAVGIEVEIDSVMAKY
jgi:predicted nucleotide-binding protein